MYSNLRSLVVVFLSAQGRRVGGREKGGEARALEHPVEGPVLRHHALRRGARQRQGYRRWGALAARPLLSWWSLDDVDMGGPQARGLFAILLPMLDPGWHST